MTNAGSRVNKARVHGAGEHISEQVVVMALVSPSSARRPSPAGVNAVGEVSLWCVVKAAEAQGATCGEQLCHLGPNAVSQSG